MEYKKYIVLVLLSIWGVCLSIQANDLPREVVNLNREWLYSRDNTAWQNIGLPHSFSIPLLYVERFLYWSWLV